MPVIFDPKVNEFVYVSRPRSIAAMRTPSRSRPGVEYRTRIAHDGTFECECRGFEHHGRCRHIEGLLIAMGDMTL